MEVPLTPKTGRAKYEAATPAPAQAAGEKGSEAVSPERKDAVTITNSVQQKPNASETRSNAAAYAWSDYMKTTMEGVEALLSSANTQQPAAGSEEKGEIDWNTILDWTPSGNKSMMENITDLSQQVQTLWNLIDQNYSGKERLQMLTRLENLFYQKIDLLYSQLQPAYDFLSQNGEEPMANLLFQVLKQTIHEKTHQTTGKASHSAQKTASTINSHREFLLTPQEKQGPMTGRSHAYSKVAAYLPEQKTQSYPLKDIQQVARFVEENQSVLQGERMQESRGKETASPSWGINLGLISAKTEAFAKHGEIHPKLAKSLQSAVQNVVAVYREKADGTIREAPSLDSSHLDSRNENGQNIRIALQINDRIAEEYKKTGNISRAVSEGIKLAKTLYQELYEKQGEPKRVQKAMSFWEILYLVKEHPELEKQHQPETRLKMNWNHFVQAMELKGGETASGLYLNFYHSGIAAGLHSSKAKPDHTDRAQPMEGILSFSWLTLSFFLIFLRVVGIQIPIPILAINLCAALITAVMVQKRRSGPGE